MRGRKKNWVMNQKKILLLGAGNAQIDAIEYCKKRSWEVIGCSYTAEDKGIPLLDHFEQVDIKDVAGVKRLAEKYQVNAVYSIGSDLAMPTAMKVSELLSLPHFVSAKTAEICHEKHLLRETLGRDFVGNEEYLVCSTLEEALQFQRYPGMMKPVDSQGQRGCFRVDCAEDVRLHFGNSLEYSKERKVILEPYVEGPEISVNTYFQNGTLRFAVVSDRITFSEFPGGIIKEHRVPSLLMGTEAEKEALDLARRIAEKLELREGPCYCQMKMDENCHPIILEVTPRLDGCHMWNLIRHYCGVNLLDACFSHLMEQKEVLIDPVNFPKEEYQLKFLCSESEKLFSREDYDCTGAEYVFWYYETGDRVKKLNGYMEKGGYLIRKRES